MNDEQRAGEDAGRGERERHLAEGRPATRVEVGRRLDEAAVHALERRVQRERHERQEVVGDAGDHGARRREQPPVVAEQAQRLHRVDDPAVVGEDRLPGHGPHDEAREERQDDQQQHEVAPAPRLERHEVGEREGDDQAQHRRRARVDQRAHELIDVLRHGVGVDAPVPRLREAVVRVARLQRHPELGDDRDRVEERQPDQARRDEQDRQQGTAAAQRQASAARRRLRRGPAGAHAPVTFCISAVSSRSGAAPSDGYGLSWARVASSGKISVLFASSGSFSARTSFTPVTGQK